MNLSLDRRVGTGFVHHLMAAALLLSALAIPGVASGEERGDQVKAGPARAAVDAPRSRSRLMPVLIGIGAGVGLGLLTGTKALPEATCKDGKVWGVAGAFGAAGALIGYSFAGRGERFDFAARSPRTQDRPLDEAIVRLVSAPYRFAARAD